MKKTNLTIIIVSFFVLFLTSSWQTGCRRQKDIKVTFFDGEKEIGVQTEVGETYYHNDIDNKIVLPLEKDGNDMPTFNYSAKNADGTVLSITEIENDLNPNKLGEYKLKYEVKDEGNTFYLEVTKYVINEVPSDFAGGYGVVDSLYDGGNRLDYNQYVEIDSFINRRILIGGHQDEYEQKGFANYKGAIMPVDLDEDFYHSNDKITLNNIGDGLDESHEFEFDLTSESNEKRYIEIICDIDGNTNERRVFHMRHY